MTRRRVLGAVLLGLGGLSLLGGLAWGIGATVGAAPENGIRTLPVFAYAQYTQRSEPAQGPGIAPGVVLAGAGGLLVVAGTVLVVRKPRRS
jgi:hypothetical protein